jgi:hypothetical protein
VRPGRFESGPSLGTLLGEIFRESQDLFQGEIKLARIEIDQKLRKVIVGAVLLVGGTFVALAGLIVILQGAAAAFALALPTWAASLIVGVVIVIGAALLARAGLEMLSLKALSPDRTWASLQKDVSLAKEHV